MSLSTEALFLQLRKHNTKALAVLYIRLGERVYKRCLKMVKIEMDAEDLMQQSFLQLWEKREQLANANDPLLYFWGIVNNTVYVYLRKEVNRNNMVAKVASWQPHSIDPDSMQERKEAHAQVCSSVQLLSPQQQNVIRLRYQEGLSYKETGAQLNISPETVKQHLKNAHHHLRDNLGGLGTRPS